MRRGGHFRKRANRAYPRPAGGGAVGTAGASAGAGFTLVEVLLALFLIAIGILAAAPMFMYSLRSTAAGADIGSAGALAGERMELIRSTDFTALVDGGSLTSNVTGYFDASHTGFDVRWQISSGGGPGDAKMIAVRAISVGGPNASPKQVTLTSLRAP